MGRVEESVLIPASLAEVWDLYFRPDTWASWVDGFAATEVADRYPEVGGTLRWRSLPAGRGAVTERVLAHEPRRLHRIAFTDPESEGELETRFEIESGGAASQPAGEGSSSTRVTQRLDYRLARRGPLAAITDSLFVRSQMRRSLARSLGRLRLELTDRSRAGPA